MADNELGYLHELTKQLQEVTRPTVLVIDNNPNATKTLCDILVKRDMLCIAANTGREGIQKAAKDQPAAAVVDLKLPDIDGMQVVQEIKSVSPATRCIIWTGFPSHRAATQAVDLGAYGYVEKSSDPTRLLQMIQDSTQEPSNGWNQSARYVLPEIARLGTEVEKLRNAFGELQAEIAALKVKAGLWSAIGAAIPVLMMLALQLLSSSN